MVSRGWVRIAHLPLGGLLALVTLLGASAGTALARDSTCSVHVSPIAAVGGSTFVFTGTGFKPTELTVQKKGGQPIVHDLNVGTSEPWTVSVRSQVGDEGLWTATFSTTGAGCSAQVEFRVTLSSTDAVSDLVLPTPTHPAPLALYLAVVVVGFAGGALIGRRLQSAGRA